MHPQVIGRGHRMLMFEALFDEIGKREDVKFVTLQEASDRWRSEQTGN